MINNDVLRRLRYTFDLSDSQMITVFAAAGKKVSRAQICDWLKKDDDPAFVKCSDETLATFLNGFINIKRGKRDGAQPKPETYLTNNLIFKKLRIALALKDDDILDILSLMDFKLSKHELSSFFRAPTHRQSRQCKDQVLRNFFNGLQKRYAPTKTKQAKKESVKIIPVTPHQPNKPKRAVLSLDKSKKEPSSSNPLQTFQWKEK